MFHYQETGLSRSRNRALQHATADLCLIGDDDVSYPDSAATIVAEAFRHNPSADIITFQTSTPDGVPFKRYGARPHWHTSRSIMRVTSCEIALRTQVIRSAGLRFDEQMTSGVNSGLPVIRSAGLRFDEQFGLGADFPTGEENIFLLDALRCGMHILYVPVPVVVHPAYSSGGDFLNHDLIRAKGAMFRRMFGAASWVVALAFACKKYRLSNVGCRHFYRLMCQGSAAYEAAR